MRDWHRIWQVEMRAYVSGEKLIVRYEEEIEGGLLSQ
jgi:hypothetical protein